MERSARITIFMLLILCTGSSALFAQRKVMGALDTTRLERRNRFDYGERPMIRQSPDSLRTGSRWRNMDSLYMKQGRYIWPVDNIRRWRYSFVPGMKGRYFMPVWMEPPVWVHPGCRQLSDSYGIDRFYPDRIPGLTDNQKKEISNLRQKLHKEIYGLNNETKKEILNLRKTYREEILKLLTPGQKEFIENNSP